MITSPKSMRLHIAIFGRRNAGKSSLFNALAHQNVSIVSDFAGTTTDPVEKSMELHPLGPVVLIDTAGLDDTGELGEMRVAKSLKVLDRADVALLVCAAGEWTEFEEDLLQELKKRSIPLVIVWNKADIGVCSDSLKTRFEVEKIPSIETSALWDSATIQLRDALIRILPEEFVSPQSLLGSLAVTDRPIVLVTPIDKEAPKGRLILPQVQTIRDILDHSSWCIVTRVEELSRVLNSLRVEPALVITDSQVFSKVSALIPAHIALTSFSILFARFKGNLWSFVDGAKQIAKLKQNDRILIAEACTHHPIEEDIGTVKIPRMLENYVGGSLQIDHARGCDFPSDLSSYKLVIHCGACVWNRRAMLSRLLECERQGIAITNYGICIAAILGILERAVSVFR